MHRAAGAVAGGAAGGEQRGAGGFLAGAGGAGDQSVGGGAGDQVGQFAAVTLGGDREAPVLDEGAGIDQVVEVLPGGAPACGVASCDGVRARSIFGQRAPVQ